MTKAVPANNISDEQCLKNNIKNCPMITLWKIPQSIDLKTFCKFHVFCESFFLFEKIMDCSPFLLIGLKFNIFSHSKSDSEL